MKLKNLLKTLYDLLYPNICIACDKSLVEEEEFFCFDCLANMPFMKNLQSEEHKALERFHGKVPLERISIFLEYNRDGIGQKIISEIKYRGNTKLGTFIGRYMAEKLMQDGFFEDIDIIIPVPLHPRKERKRGFNQSKIIAEGISEITGIPLNTTSLYREKANPSQTKKNIYERWLNTKDIFLLKNKQDIRNKHILLFDDVLTTGSTLEACILCFRGVRGVRVSVLTLTAT